jgi:adenylosuccinate synthase
MEKIKVVVDLQYGSTGKGLIVGKIAEDEAPDTVITAWAPNAGHTYIGKDGRKFIHTHLANGIVSPALRHVLLGPGSAINPQQLLAEIDACSDLLENVRISIHPHAAIVTDRHVEEEAGPMTKIGSTKKGVGAAMCQRIRRDPDDLNIAANCSELEGYVTTVGDYRARLREARSVLVEGAQGYGLSMYHGFYPYTTSRDVSLWQILADCGIPHDLLPKVMDLPDICVIGTCRTYPIRVANRFDTHGTQVGYSGPCYDDQLEVSFEEIGQKTELTTVTKLPRRIFTFSQQQIQEAVSYNGAREIFLNFVNYCRFEDEVRDIVQSIERVPNTYVRWIGLGPEYKDVYATPQYSTDLRLNRILELWRVYATGRINSTHGRG